MFKNELVCVGNASAFLLHNLAANPDKQEKLHQVTFNHRFSMELDIWAPGAQLYSLAETLKPNPLPRPHLGSYTKAIRSLR